MATSVTRWRGVLVAAVIGALWPLTQLAHPLDLRAWDRGFATLMKLHPAAPANDIVVVGLDEATLAAVPEPVALLHQQLGALLQALAASGAKAVALDVVLPDRSFDAIVPGYDVALLQGILAMRSAGILVLARTVDEAGVERAIHPPLLAAAGAEGSGFALLPVDRDGTIRRIDEGLGTGSGDGSTDVATLVGQLARRLGAVVAPGLIDYAHPIGVTPVSMLTVLDEFRAGHTVALKAALAGKIVFVGALLPFVDRHRVPVALSAERFPVAATPGVYIHAQALQTLLTGGPIKVVPGAASLLAALLCALAWRVCSHWRAAVLTLVIGLVVLALIAPVTLAARHAVAVASPALALIAFVLLRFGLEVRAEISARRRLRQTFAGYVSPAVMAELEAGRLDGMASERRFVCVMFMDVRGFTTRSETDSPEQVTSVLNRLFEAATDVIHRHGGTVKEFMGDGVMAFFGAPRSLPSPAQAGFDAARAMFASLDRVNADLQTTGQAPLAIGIGLACGEAVVGHIGAASRHAYGAVGDCVNLASRLEGLTKSLGHPLLMSAAVQALIDDRGQVVPLGRHAIKGHSAVEVFGYPRGDQDALREHTSTD